MGVVYYKQNKNILEPHLSWEGMRLVYVSFNDSKETLTPTAVHCHENNLELQYICGGRGNIRIGRRLYEVQKGISSSIIRENSTMRARTRRRACGSTTAA